MTYGRPIIAIPRFHYVHRAAKIGQCLKKLSQNLNSLLFNEQLCIGLYPMYKATIRPDFTETVTNFRILTACDAERAEFRTLSRFCPALNVTSHVEIQMQIATDEVYTHRPMGLTLLLCCRKMCSFGLKMHQIHFRPIGPGPRCRGSL